jgi:hypothetical protein
MYTFHELQCKRTLLERVIPYSAPCSVSIIYIMTCMQREEEEEEEEENGMGAGCIPHMQPDSLTLIYQVSEWLSRSIYVKCIVACVICITRLSREEGTYFCASRRCTFSPCFYFRLFLRVSFQILEYSSQRGSSLPIYRTNTCTAVLHSFLCYRRLVNWSWVYITFSTFSTS